MATSYVDKNVQFHNKLNPRIWQEGKINIDVQVHLLQTALRFAKFIGVEPLPLVDVQLTGSLASYNYTPYSDFDLHLILDKSKLSCDDDLTEQLFKSKQLLWNTSYPVQIFGHDVELYVQDINQENVTNGCYSLLHSKWVEQPRREQPKINDQGVRNRVRSFMQRIDQTIENGDVAAAEKVKEKISKMRKSGIAKHGQYGIENLTFKVLRNQGYLDKLSLFIKYSLVRELTLS